MKNATVAGAVAFFVLAACGCSSSPPAEAPAAGAKAPAAKPPAPAAMYRK